MYLLHATVTFGRVPFAKIKESVIYFCIISTRDNYYIYSFQINFPIFPQSDTSILILLHIVDLSMVQKYPEKRFKTRNLHLAKTIALWET